MIPKIIHFIWWQGKDKIPIKFLHNIKSWKINNPNYKIIIWDESKILDLIKNKNYHLENLKKYKYMIQKIDYSKYLILYHYGGVYVDTDMYCNGNLDNFLLNDKINVGYFPIVRFYKTINNGFIGVPKNNDTILNIINKCNEVNYDFYFKELTILFTTGPIFFDAHIKSEKNLNLLEQDIIYEIDDTDINKYNDKGKLAIHLHEFSWINKNLIYLINISMFTTKYFNTITILFLVLVIVLYLYTKK